MKYFLNLLLLFTLAQLSRCDETRIKPLDNTNKIDSNGAIQDQSGPITRSRAKQIEAAQQPSNKLDIVRQFFEFEGINPDLEDKTLERYDKEVVEKMGELLRNKNNFMLSFQLNGEVNWLIFESISRQVKSTDQLPLESANEVTLQTIDLMAPDSRDQPTFKLAKDDLRQFCSEQPKHCGELLEQVNVPLKEKQFHTMNVISFLEAFYFNWIPLGRLTEYIDNFGQVASS